MNRLISLVAVLALCTAAFADVVGKWSGTITIEMDKTTKEQVKGQIPQMPTLNLELRADKTYKGSQSGAGAGDNVAEGKWALSGNQLTLTPLKRNGKPATGEGAKPRVYTLSKDGKTLTLDLTSQFRTAAKQGGAKEVSQFKAKMVLRKK